MFVGVEVGGVPVGVNVRVKVDVGVKVGVLVGHTPPLNVNSSRCVALRLEVLHEYCVYRLPVSRCTPTVALFPLVDTDAYTISNCPCPSNNLISKLTAVPPARVLRHSTLSRWVTRLPRPTAKAYTFWRGL